MESMHRNRLFLTWTGLLTLACLGACAQQPSPKKDIVFDQWRARAEQSRGYSPPVQRRIIDMPEVKPRAGRSVVLNQRDQKPLPDKAVTLKMHQADLSVLLRALARSVGISIIINENVQGRTSINIEKIPWSQVFEGILKTHGLSYTWEGSLLRILTLEDKANIVKQLEADQNILTKQREIALAEPLVTKIVHIDYAKADNLKSNLEQYLARSEKGKGMGSVLFDTHNNALIIQATRSDLMRMIALISELDQPTPQVLIEAHIIEATSETARALGVQWGGLYTGNDYWITPNAGDGIGKTGGATIDPTSGWSANLPADLSGASVAGSSFALGVITKTSDLLLSAQLNALEEEGKLNILSKPSITTLDNQTAVIESGDEVPFQTVDDNKVKIEYKKAVLRLEVTPHVIEGDTLKLDIVTNKDELDFTRTVLGNPTVITKKAKTNVVLFDGQTTVIGGLNKQTDRDLSYGVPGLKNLPLLGHLFKGQGKNRQMQELLIFITPHILKRRGEQPPVTPEQVEQPALPKAPTQ